MNKCDGSLVFRALSKNDLEELYELLNNLSANAKKFFHPHSFDKPTLTKICESKKDHYFVAAVDRKIIGYSMLRLFGYEVPSFGCCIHRGFEGKKYGTVLAKWTIEKARELGYEKVILKTYKENVPALKIYKKIGFEIVGETKDEKQYKMEMRL